MRTFKIIDAAGSLGVVAGQYADFLYSRIPVPLFSIERPWSNSPGKGTERYWLPNRR